MAGRWWGIAVSATLTLAAGAGLLAMTGGARGVLGADLRAEVHVTDYPLPTGFGIEPELVAEFLSASLQKRAGEDIALRFSLGTEGLKRLQEIALPRLMNVVVVRAMIRDVKPLSDLLAVGAFRRAAPRTRAPDPATASPPGASRAHQPPRHHPPPSLVAGVSLAVISRPIHRKNR